MAIGEGSEESSDDEEEEDEGEDEVEDGAVTGREIHEQDEEEEAGEGFVSHRIALVNLDWDHLRAVDLLSILKSFDSHNCIKEVVVFPSNEGMEKMVMSRSMGVCGYMHVI
jgi:hypothetical protein